MKFQHQDIKALHSKCGRHRTEILESQTVGCFYCVSLAPLSQFSDLEWIDEDPETGIGQTLLCPSCGIDSVLPDTIEHELTIELLQAMRLHCFGHDG